MKLETIYNELVDMMNDNMNVMKALKLKEKLEKAIREETCYKTTSKTRVNAIKRVASKREERPVLTGYGIYEDYKVITDTYHLVFIKEENMPLKLVTSDRELADKVGHENCIYGDYPNVGHFINFNKDNEIKIDINDILAFYKMHHKNADKELYELGEYGNYNIDYLKNMIDILGTNVKVYYQGDLRPLYFINESDEVGLVLPCRKF